MFSFFNSVPSVTTSELEEKINKNAVLLDVRTPREFRSGHIRGAKNVPLSEVGNYDPKDKKVYVICQSGMRSKRAAKMLKNNDADVVNVRGGMSAWTGRTVQGK
ncbi:rhodanese-like domain-containing protein [Salinicoccus roseus]|uniref:Rhodanese-like domain-containing protein n=1 Tax=Salinicoccus roseus TaxID=45670 RepID=A0A0C2DLR4_9STAP|nr:rhodanese-like domain-containing protein [Salinicoccus roseus]KIH70953.1 hypothetical protein SN16_05185 [Salinicoccus roseus]MDB0580178.1 rhodanese-like domain-containing protein [Salinicoccus roseus]OZT78269.1 rhodanese-like domain-containing protein [Salinicoccus roseus]